MSTASQEATEVLPSASLGRQQMSIASTEATDVRPCLFGGNRSLSCLFRGNRCPSHFLPLLEATDDPPHTPAPSLNQRWDNPNDGLLLKHEFYFCIKVYIFPLFSIVNLFTRKYIMLCYVMLWNSIDFCELEAFFLVPKEIVLLKKNIFWYRNAYTYKASPNPWTWENFWFDTL